MADPNTGTAGAVAGLLADAKAALPAQAEQLDLLADGQRPAGHSLRWDGPALAAEIERTAKAKAGRPKGAQNLATKELKAWIVQLLGGTPQERLARWTMLEPEELAKRLGCTVQEAFDKQAKILTDLSPYFMARMVPVDDQGRPLPFIGIAIAGQMMGGGDGRAPWERAFQTVDGEAVEDLGIVDPAS